MSSIIRWYPSLEGDSPFWRLYHVLRDDPRWREILNYYIRVPGILFYDFHGFVGNAAVNLLWMYGVGVYQHPVHGYDIIDHHLVDPDLLIFWRDIMRQGPGYRPLSNFSLRVRNNPLFMQLPTNPLGYNATYCAPMA